MTKIATLLTVAAAILLSGCSSSTTNSDSAKSADQEREDLKRELSETKAETTKAKNGLDSLNRMSPSNAPQSTK